jgi:carbon-monoxide dehydrogenase iron sulfur subunit
MGSFIAVNHEPCTGCKTCEILCSLYHFGECNPVKSAIHVIRRERGGLVFCLPLVCLQCEPAPCIQACPTDAISRDEDNRILTFKNEECIDCGLCMEACQIGCLAIDDGKTSVIHCDLCGGEPQCIPACHAHCLSLANDCDTNRRKDLNRIVGILEREDLLKYLPGRGNA